MRIGLVSTAATPVRPTGAGSVESLVHALARQLVSGGHDVTVFGAAGSRVDGAEVVETLPGTYGAGGSPDDWRTCEWLSLCAAVERSATFDVLHSHAYLLGIALEPLSACPMVHTMHVQPYDGDAALWRRSPRSTVTALSHAQWSGHPELEPAAVVPHGVDVRDHTWCGVPGEYLLFLGRFMPGKGVLAAIAAARELETPLVLAGPENDYFRRRVAPHVDGVGVRFAGAVSAAARDRLYGEARALLYPVQEPEPFGLVMVESMVSGTPVAALGTGAVAEVVDDGLTGAIAPSPEALPAAVRRCLELDRRAVGRHARERFSLERMVASYTAVYERVA